MNASRILVIDDEPGIRAFIEYALAARGLGVDAAEDGARGLALYALGRYACVLTDMSMPGMQGEELAAAIRERDPEARIVLMSGTETEVSTADGLPILRKPFTLPELFLAVAGKGFPAAGAQEGKG